VLSGKSYKDRMIKSTKRDGEVASWNKMVINCRNYLAIGGIGMLRQHRSIEDLDKRLKILRWDKHEDLLSNIAKAGGEVYNEFKNWTPLKLCGLSYFAGGYARILQKLKTRQFSGKLDVIFIDLFSGCGINKIKDVLIAGSPLVCIDSVTNSQAKFDTMFFNDATPKYYTALGDRLEFLSRNDSFAWIENRYHIMNKDCNKALDDIVGYLNQIRYKNYLAFVDPYHMEIWWHSMERLLSIEYGDIMITFQAKLVARSIGTYLSSGSPSHGEKIRKFLGEENEGIIKQLNNEKAVKEYHINKIRNYRKFIVDIEIRSGRSNPYRYYLIFASRRKDPPWRSYIIKMKKLVESFSGDLVKASLDFLTGKMLRLS
jgi:three-Cys-motif partner protein